jgi:hypothetical protein
MTPQRTAQQIEEAILQANAILARALARTEKDIYDAILIELKKLDLDAQGYIKPTAANRKTTRDVGKLFDKALSSSGYAEELSAYIATINSIDAINASYFNSIRQGYSTTFVKSLQKQTITELEGLLLNDGLEAQIKQPLLKILDQNINIGGSYSGMIEQVKAYTIGVDKGDGKLMRYVKQITQDALNNYSRSYQSAVGDALGLEFHCYVGGTMKESRQFCKDRVGKFYHYKEIESWAKEDWNGKRPDTTESSIFVYAGGYNCYHQIIPVSTFLVPKEDIERAKELAYYLLP